MLPIKLSISGLYSYQKKQTVDFEKLSASGLFGIFGKVGSGKSTILEAISYALYGQTERLNARDGRTYNMMNLKSNEVLIEFDFENHAQKKFRFRARWKRNKNQFSETSTADRQAFEWKDEQWIPLDSNDATEIIGLSYENFKRTLIIPQGQFKEFLDLKDTDRAKMMKEIFKLEAYDLSDKVNGLLKKTDADLTFLNGKLTAYEDINLQEIGKQEAVLETLKLALKSAIEKRDVLEKKIAASQKIEATFQDLNLKKQAFEKLEKQKENIQILQQKLTEYETVKEIFQQKIARFQEYKQSMDKQTIECSKTKKAFETCEIELNQEQTSLKKISTENALVENWNKQHNDYKKIISISTVFQNKKSIDARCEIGEKLVIEEENHLKKYEIEEAELKSKNIEESEKIIEPQIIFEVKQWFANKKKSQFEIEKKTNQLQKITFEKDQLLKKCTDLGFNLHDWNENILRQQEENSKKLAYFQKEMNAVLVQKELISHAQNLQEGEACPVCGSVSHPNVMNDEDVSISYNTLKNSIDACHLKSEEIKTTEKTLQTLQLNFNQKREEILKIEEELRKAQLELKDLETSFRWSAFDQKDESRFETIENEQKTLQQNLKIRTQTIEDNRTKQSETQKKINQAKELLNKLKLEREKDMATVDALKNELSVLKWEDFELTDSSILESEMNALAMKIETVKSKFATIQNRVLQLEKKNIQLKSDLKHLEQQLQDSELNFNKLNEEINQLLIAHHYESVEKITQILASPMDVNQTRNTIQEFKNQYQNLKQQIQDLEQQTQGLTFDVAAFEAEKIAFTQSKSEVTNLLAKEMTTQTEIDNLKFKLTEKQQLELQKETLENRSLNLKTLSNLFKGQGFVEYVSGVYLRNLCDIANQRFHRMTKNSLSLTLNEKNNFEIIDYLNQGFTRSIKTLSGGQSFQAALCLALALAENVQSLSKTDKNFFFIDEGFGTQDPDSIEVIYETLEQLHKENRVVGIISHSENLQEKITNHIRIENDVELGSQVFYN